ncbi:nucleoside phosphorylase domain-containing protein [Camillea tinctor]|nr:nucleoside phosphorylase domain-containing protein [Camillea tinctor]
MDFVVPDQVIDRTKGNRPFTFFEGGLVGHVPFGDPYDGQIAEVVRGCAKSMEGEGVVLHPAGTAICMEGPQFSTRAESNLYRAWGGSVISMSLLPEAKLAREAELAYQVICMATDYDCWHTGESDVDVSMVMRYMEANGRNARRLVGAVLDELCRRPDLVAAKHWEGASLGAVMFCTKPEGRDPKALERVQYLFPGFLAEKK